MKLEKILKVFLIGSGVFSFLLILVPTFIPDSTKSDYNPPQEQVVEKDDKKWYEGGTLHDGNMGDWNQSTYEDRLATSADFLAALWQKGDFKDEVMKEITSVDSMKPMAEVLVGVIDAYYIEKTKNEKVKDVAVLAILLAGWTEGKEWYEGGTLHDGNMEDWNQSTYEDKLATSADFLAALWLKGNFKDEVMKEITSVDSMKPMAEVLVGGIDGYYTEKTKNEKIKDVAVLAILLAGWTEN